MNAPLPISRPEKSPRLKRLLQEPLTFIIFIWMIMLTLVGLCFVLMD